MRRFRVLAFIFFVASVNGWNWVDRSNKEITTIMGTINEFRSNIKPTPSNMNYVIWSQNLVDHCGSILYQGGCTESRIDDARASNRKYGNAFHYGYSPQEFVDRYLNEIRKMNFTDKYAGCSPPSSQCQGRATFVLSSLKEFGCATCGGDGYNYIGLCAFSDNIFSLDDYKVPFLPGLPCSECDPPTYWPFCHPTLNLCISKEICDNEKIEGCTCRRPCLNHSIRDTIKCSCSCKVPWESYESPHCEEYCEDKVRYCGKIPGYPMSYCSTNEIIRNNLCRKTCGTCKGLNPYNLIEEDTACLGQRCAVGYSLLNNCTCALRKVAVQEVFDIYDGKITTTTMAPRTTNTKHLTTLPTVTCPFAFTPANFSQAGRNHYPNFSVNAILVAFLFFK